MKHSKETKSKLSEMRRGKNNPMYGRKHTPEALKKIGIATRRRNLKHQYALDPINIPEINEHDLGYLAGIIDGEGSINISRGRPAIHVYGSDRRLMNWLLEKIGGTVTWEADKRGLVPGHCWNMYAAKNVFHLCRLIWTSLVIKQEKAKEIIEFLKKKYGDRIYG